MLSSELNYKSIVIVLIQQHIGKKKKIPCSNATGIFFFICYRTPSVRFGFSIFFSHAPRRTKYVPWNLIEIHCQNETHLIVS